MIGVIAKLTIKPGTNADFDVNGGLKHGELRGHLTFVDRGNGVRVVIVEVPARGEDLDRLEAVTGDIDEVFAAQPLFVKEMRRDAETTIRQPLIIAIRRGVPPAVRGAARGGGRS